MGNRLVKIEAVPDDNSDWRDMSLCGKPAESFPEPEREEVEIKGVIPFAGPTTLHDSAGE
jgi:hypothetical protein